MLAESTNQRLVIKLIPAGGMDTADCSAESILNEQSGVMESMMESNNLSRHVTKG